LPFLLPFFPLRGVLVSIGVLHFLERARARLVNCREIYQQSRAMDMRPGSVAPAAGRVLGNI
jgi:hypothetical protein